MSNYNNPFAIPKPIIMERLRPFLDQDIGFGDLSSGVIPPDATAKARVFSKSNGLIAGSEEAGIIFEYLKINVELMLHDGDTIAPNDTLMEVEGNLRNILIAERTALDFLMKLSSIATSTAKMIEPLKTYSRPIILAATRKVTPGFGWFEKKAVFIGGGDTHRWNLSDMVLLKNTHIKYYQNDIDNLVKTAKSQAGFSKKIEIEIEDPDDVMKAVQAGADIILLDNMLPDQIQEIITQVRTDPIAKRVMFEASGNITHENYLEYAETGIDIISTSELILHPFERMDFSLRLIDQ
jgi:nicotinate-nucleotide pyrophosphorylase (carboxylating)